MERKIIPEITCPHCGMKTNVGIPMSGAMTLSPNAVIVCVRCANASVMKRDGTLRKATGDDMFNIMRKSPAYFEEITKTMQNIRDQNRASKN